MLRQRQKEKEKVATSIVLIITLIIASFFIWFINKGFGQRQKIETVFWQLPPLSKAEKQLRYKYLDGMRGPDNFYRELLALPAGRAPGCLLN